MFYDVTRKYSTNQNNHILRLHVLDSENFENNFFFEKSRFANFLSAPESLWFESTIKQLNFLIMPTLNLEHRKFTKIGV